MDETTTAEEATSKERRAPGAQVRLSSAERRVLRDLAARAELSPAKFAARAMESSRLDFMRARDTLVRAKFIVDGTIPAITPAGLIALRGAR